MIAAPTTPAHPADLAEDLRELRWLIATTARLLRERCAVVLEAEGSRRLAQDARKNADRLERVWSQVDRALAHII